MTSATPRTRRWLIYALGGGLGHLHRAVALARAATRGASCGRNRSRTEIVLITNSPFADGLSISNEIGQSQRIMRINPSLDRDRTADRVVGLVQSESWDALIVDTFPRGLGGELAEILPGLSCRKILVHRDLNPTYCERFGLQQFVQHFDRLLVPGESAPFENSGIAVRTAPWLIRDEHELLTVADARVKLKVQSGRLPVVAVLGCGRAEEISQMRHLASELDKELASRAAVRFVSIAEHGDQRGAKQPKSDLTTISLWPFFQAIRGVSVIVGGGGYNSVNEARATQTRYIGIPWPRLYDRQNRRLSERERVGGVKQVTNAVRNALESDRPVEEHVRSGYDNGVHQAIETIEGLYA